MGHRVGMIGAGHIARAHASVWRNEARITAVCSRQLHKAEQLATEFDIPVVCANADELIAREDVDIVSIATPHHLHHPLSIQAMEAGKHVFCEKPLARNVQEAREMWACAQRTGVKTGIQFSERISWPSLIRLHEQIRGGDLGQIHYFEGAWSFDWARSPEFPIGWRFKQDMAGPGALGDLGVYMIDAARWLIGEITGVCGHLDTFITHRPVISQLYDFAEVRRMSREGTLPHTTEMAEVENDDTCTILATFDNGAHGMLHASRLQRGNTIYVEGARCAYMWDLQSTKLMRRGWDEDRYSEVPVPDRKAFATMVTQFLANITNNTHFPPTFYDGLRAQEVVDAVIRSTEKRRWIEIQ